LVIIAIITVAIELALFLITWRGPAFAGLIRPVYLIVLIAAAISAWHAARRRPGGDRRHADRRDADHRNADHRDAAGP